MNSRERLQRFPFRIGTTSYIIPDDILPNVRFLADKVDDIELVLFDVDQFCNIPSREQVAELQQMAATANLTYTIHLPLDLQFSADESQISRSLAKARQVIDALHCLRPHAYIAHLDSHSIVKDPSETEASIWVERCVQSLQSLLPELQDTALLAVENLESYPPALNHRVLAQVPASECIDIGHLWLQEIDVPPYLDTRLDRTRVIHLHGIDTRDHQSLRHMPIDNVKTVIGKLIEKNYSGVVTLEVFSQDDFFSSMEVLDQL